LELSIFWNSSYGSETKKILQDGDYIMDYKEVKIEIYVPMDFVVSLRDALNEIGACRVGNYDNCISVTQVSGYWRPLEGATPYNGTVGKISCGQECKMEVRCKKDYIMDAIHVIKKVHPYEEPLYNIIPTVNHLYE
jgi:hypothetical protein